MRIQRGVNAWSQIESAVLQPYIGAASSPETLARLCRDDTTWHDDGGRTCHWYQEHDAGCRSFQDSGYDGIKSKVANQNDEY